MELPDLSHPERLWWLLLLPVLYLLARPPFPRRVVDTPHMVQWRRAQERLGRRPVRFRRLRFLLLVGAFALSILAFAGPTTGGTPGPGKLAVILDSSASMAAQAEDRPAPWEEAVDAVRAVLSTLPDHVEVKLARVGEQVDITEPEPVDPPVSFPDPSGTGRFSLADLADQMRDRDTEIWTLTDGLGPTRPPRLGALTLLGGPLDNVALVAGELTDRWPLPELRMQLEVINFAPAVQNAVLSVSGPVEPVEDAVLELPPGVRTELAVEMRRTGPGVLRVSLDAERNFLAADDQLAWQVPGPPAPVIAVLADEESGPWIHAAAQALAEESGGQVAEGVTAAGFLLVEGGVMDMEPGRRRALYFGTRATGSALEPQDLWQQPVVVDWDREDPLTAGMDLSDLRIDDALSRILPEGKTLIQGERGPLMVLVEGEDRATIHTAFRMSDSNIGLLPAFPQLLRRSLSRAYGQPALPRPIPPRLLSPRESDLRGGEVRPENRPLRAFGTPGRSLAVPLLILALLCLAVRVYT